MSSTGSVSLHDLIVCACGTQEYAARDAIDAAIFRDELDLEWKEFLHRVEAERRGDELDLDLDESTISSAAEAFRYEHERGWQIEPSALMISATTLPVIIMPAHFMKTLFRMK